MVLSDFFKNDVLLLLEMNSFVSFQIGSALGRGCPLLGTGSKWDFLFFLGNWKLLSNGSCGESQAAPPSSQSQIMFDST